MYLMAALFWALDFIPIVNIFTNAMYWMIWTGIFLYKYLPVIRNIASEGISVGINAFKIVTISIIALILGEIPIISMFPWDIIANILINRIVKKMLASIENIRKDVQKLSQAYNTEVSQRMIRRRTSQAVLQRERYGG